MRCNFFNDFKKVNILGLLWSCFRLTLLFMTVFSILKMGFNVWRSYTLFTFQDAIYSFILSVISVILYCVAVIYSNYRTNKKLEYVFYNFSDFKKWYGLTPEKFVFDENCLHLYYLHTDNHIDYDSFMSEYSFERFDGSVLYPKTFIDAMRYYFFVNKCYSDLIVHERKMNIQKAEMKSYDETVKVMTSLQKDINKILEESNKVISKETKKMGVVSNEL